jgi:hypothetical protein
MSFKVSFDQFKKDPMKAILYLALGAIMYLYIDNKMVTSDQISYLMDQNTTKDVKIDKLQEDIMKLSVKIAEIRPLD